MYKNIKEQKGTIYVRKKDFRMHYTQPIIFSNYFRHKKD
jgi:hypothetical protein